MRLVDLAQGTKVALEVIITGNNYEFPTTILSKKNDYVLVEPVRVDGKVVGFGGSNLTLNLILNRKDLAPLMWKGISCSVVSFKGLMQYKVVASGEGFEMNRRNAYRIFIGIEGVAQMGVNHKAVGVVVKDVSETGFSFVSEEDMDHAENLAVRLVFADLERNFSLMGLVVRKEVLAEKKVVYACKLSMKNQLLPHYIVDKQRQKLILNKKNVHFETEESLQRSLKKATSAASERKSKELATSTIHGPADIVSGVDKSARRKMFKESRPNGKTY